MRKMIALVVLLLAGCATHQVQPYGPDTFIVSGYNYFTGSRASTETKMIASANAFCGQSGKTMRPQASNVSGNMWTGASGRLVFNCVAR